MMIFKLNFNQVCLNHGELFRIRDFQRLLGVGWIGETSLIRQQKQQQQQQNCSTWAHIALQFWSGTVTMGKNPF